MLRTSSDGLGVAYDWKEKEMKADWGPVKGSKPLPAAFVGLSVYFVTQLTPLQIPKKRSRIRTITTAAIISFIFMFCHHIFLLSSLPFCLNVLAVSRIASLLSMTSSNLSPLSSTCVSGNWSP